MGTVGPELSSIAYSLEELTRRITRIAEGAAGTQADRLATELFAVERTLIEARRRLARSVDRANRTS